MSNGCDWAFSLVALNPSALSKAVPASPTSTPPCMSQCPAAGWYTQVLAHALPTQRQRAAAAAAEQQHKTARFAASVSLGRGHVEKPGKPGTLAVSQAFLDDMALLLHLPWPVSLSELG